MKFAVHWAPSVNSCTPGWMAALDDGAHVGAALAAVPAASGARHPVASSTAEAAAPFRRPVAQETRTYPSLLLATPVYPLESGTKPPFGSGPGRRSPGGVPRWVTRGGKTVELSLDWRSVGLRGLAAVAFGILILVWPDLTVTALVLLFGVFVLVDGFAHLVVAFGVREGRGWQIFEGLAGVAAGIITLVWPDITALALLYVIGAWAVILGALRIVVAVQLRKEIPNEWLLIVSGALSVAFGIVLFVAPVSGALAITWLIGFFALFVGMVLLALAWRLRKSHTSVDVYTSPPPAPA